MKNINELNIANLTALWTKVGRLVGNYSKVNACESSVVNHSQWPNKIWIKEELNTKLLDQLTEQMVASKIDLVFPHWNIYSDEIKDLAPDTFIQKSEQTGMSLKLDQAFELSNSLNFKRVSQKEEVKLWTSIYPKCFGYVISEEILSKTKDEIAFYLFYANDELVGTAIYFPTNEVVGIHGVGIIPEMRKKGFAEEIMKILLNKAISESISYATLQASPLGKGIYKRLGFTEDFTIKNYGLKAI
ncbi:GNAT family N-acetyltransferase [Pedobacter ureilyticus]|uniref:GNAT family N-acetyltransferase n=1 Tax=Pedobacter ureilyticus TaxID=1393051 RepID=A0ABW9JAZ7_9SPHI|nr:GNAT family N-acetyltransferase [Pedobacter helvus]